MNNSIAQKIKEIIKGIGSRADVDTLKADIPLSEQGVDSLDMANIFLNLEESFNVKVPDEDINKLQSIDDMVQYFAKK